MKDIRAFISGARRRAAGVEEGPSVGYLVVSLLLEAGMRAVRIPLFPGFAPLLEAGSWPTRRHAISLAAVAAVEGVFLGSAGLELAAAVLAGLLVASRTRARALVFSLVAAAAWSLIGMLTGRFPVGAFGLEALLTAALMRVTGVEGLAGFASRLLLMALVYASMRIVSLGRRWGRRLGPAAFSAALLIGCGQPEQDYFRPETADPASVVLTRFGDETSRGLEHPVFPADGRGNEVCLACHGQRIAPTDRPPGQKGIHELHYQYAQFDKPCVYCHEQAGRPGFPGEYPAQGARTQYNQKCVACHAGEAGPEWKRRFR